MIAMALILASFVCFPIAAAALTTDPHVMSPSTAIWVQPGASLSTISLLQYATQHALPSHIHKLSTFSESKYSCICFCCIPPEEFHTMRSCLEALLQMS